VWYTQKMVSSKEFSEWVAWERIEVREEDRADLRVALSTAQIINHICGALGAKVSLTADDVLLRTDPGTMFPSEDALQMKMNGWKASMDAHKQRTAARKKMIAAKKAKK